MIMSQFNRVHASEELTGRNLKQRSLEVVENMPNISSHYKILDWAKRGKDLNDFVFDYTATNFDKKTEFSVKEGRTFSTIYRDDKYGGYMIPAFYGEDRPLRSTEKHDGEDDQESISVTSALIVASLTFKTPSLLVSPTSSDTIVPPLPLIVIVPEFPTNPHRLLESFPL